MTEPNAAPLVAPAPAAAPTPTPEPTQPATAPAWTLEVDNETRYTDPAKARESFLDARRQIAEHKGLVDRFSGYTIKYEDGREVSASEDPEAFFSLVGTLLAQQGAAARGAAAQPAPGDEKLDPSKLTPEWQSAISTLRRTGQFAAADQMQALTDKLTALEQQVQGVTQAQTSGEQARKDSAIAEGRSILGEVAKTAGFALDDKGTAALASAIEDQIVRASSDPKTGQMLPSSVEDRYLRGDRSVREAIVKEQFAIWQAIADGYAAHKNSSAASLKERLIAGQPKPLGSPGTGALAPQKRPTESERMETLRGILSQSA